MTTTTRRRALFAIFGSVARLRELLAGAGRHVECARLVDARGVLACIVLTWSYGVSYTFGADGRLLAFGSQHDVEAWNLEQRALFFEIDEALRTSTPLHQPLSFAWWDDGLWEELAPGEDRGDPMLAALR